MSDFVSMVDSQEDALAKGPNRPFWSLDFTKEAEVLEWLNTEVAHLKEQARERVLNQKKNLAVYRGIQYSNTDRRTRDESADDAPINKRKRNPRVVYNHMVDMVEQDAARMTKYRGAITAKPGSDDNTARVTAEIGEDLIEKFWNKTDVDRTFVQHARRKRIMGEDFIWCVWDPTLGPYDPDWLAEVFKEKGLKKDPRAMSQADIFKTLRDEVGELPRIPLVDDKGNQVEINGQKVTIDKPMRLGDVRYRLWMSWNMFLQRKETYDQVEYGFGREFVDVDTLKAQHPSKAADITADTQGNSFYDAESCEDAEYKNKAETFHFYHRSTEMLEQGRYIKFTRGKILINKPNDKYRGRDYRAIFPWVRSIDIDTPGVLNGDATVTHGRGPQQVYNNLVSLRVRNRFLFSYPKWWAPSKSIKIETLANGTSVGFYKGPAAPTLSQPAINESNEAAMLQEAKGDLQQIMGVYGVSRGDPPAGVTAAVALTFLDEQESERANVGVQTQTSMQKELAERTLWLMSDNYEDDEGRLEALLGKNEAAQLGDFKMADLRSIGDIMIQNTTALPQQKSARLQWILDIKKEFPELVPADLAVDLLGLGDVERMRNIITVAIRKAESENGRMMNGADVPDALPFEYHLAHYRLHIRQMNELSYDKLPKASQKRFKTHTAGHEFEMLEVAKRNPQFLALVLKEFPGFPYFYVPEEMADATPGQLAEAEEAAAAGAQPPAVASPAPLVPPPMPGPEAMPPGGESQMPMPEASAPGAEMIQPQPGV